MYSQCPQCQAIFGVSAAHISAHQGLVRCGRCRAVFHAVTNQVDDSSIPSAPRDADVPRSTIAVEPPDAPDREVEPPRAASDQDRIPLPTQDDTLEPDHTADASQEHYAEEPLQVVEDEVREVEPEETEPEETEPEETEPEETEPAAVAPDEELEPDRPGDDLSEYPGEVEEILIEAPPVLWNAFDDDHDDERTVDKETDAPPPVARVREKKETVASRLLPRIRARRKAPDSTGPEQTVTPETPAPSAAEQEADRRSPLKSPYRAKDIRMVELPQPRPFKTMSLSLIAVVLILLLLWQIKAFYLEELAQVPVFRPYIETLCRPLGCDLPPRHNFAQIDLVGTSISLNPEVPGALAIKASLINRAHFPQPYPLLRVTLTDREGRVVGRRTYLPSEYGGGELNGLLPIKEVRDVSINLVQPAENAVGYEVELVSPHSENS